MDGNHCYDLQRIQHTADKALAGLFLQYLIGRYDQKLDLVYYFNCTTEDMGAETLCIFTK